MTETRRAAFDLMCSNLGVPVELVTRLNYKDYELEQFPFHPAYEYLSAVHKSDYLRTYFMHHHGGGYADIKPIYSEWAVCFERLENSDKFALGYTEIGPKGVAKLPEPLGSFLKSNYHCLLGNGAYIFKPRTSFTSDWYFLLHHLLDVKFELLSQTPAVEPREAFERPMSTGCKSLYPIRWTEMLGDLFHPLCWKYRDKLLHGLPKPDFENYQ